MGTYRPVHVRVQRFATRVPHAIQALWHGLKRQIQHSKRFVASFWSASEGRRWISANRGYFAAPAAVAVASLLIALVEAQVHIRNISLIYLLPVLWLAAVYGRGPAVFASMLSFLAYDFLFISPIRTFTVSDPAEWLSLFALLATSLVLGQLTAAVQARAREALESQQRTVILYGLAQLIVTTTEPERLYTALIQRMVEVFTPHGVRACALILHNEPAGVQTQAVAPEEGIYADALSLDLRDNAGSAEWAIGRGAVVGGSHRAGHDGAYVQVYFVPLKSGRRVVGALGIAGAEDIRQLVRPVAAVLSNLASYPMASPVPDRHRLGDTTWQGGEREQQRRQQQQVTLFAGFCDQIALALDRSALQQQAIHAEALRESSQLKDVLLGSVTHDLRTPIASIKAAVSSLRHPEVTWSEEERSDFLQSIDASTDRLNRLVGNLLDLSRLEAGTAPPEKDWYLIGDVVATVLDRLELTGQTEDRQIVVEIPDDLPLVPMDYGQIEQVLTNLLENAVKYSPGGSMIRIVARTPTPSELEMRVEDQGIGIPPNEREAIFDKFYRIQHVQLPWAMTRPPVGTGLGLAICAAIIRAHGGRIWAESGPGDLTSGRGPEAPGATFVFTLPIPQERPQGTLPDLEVPEGVEGAAPEPTAMLSGKASV